MTRLQETVTTVLLTDVASLPPSTILAEIDTWDSLRHVTLVLTLEQTFGVRLSADEIRSMVTVGDITRVMKEKGIDG